MTDAQARRVPNAELKLRDGPVVRDSGELRVPTGEEYGLVTSVTYARIVPRSRHLLLTTNGLPEVVKNGPLRIC